MGMYNFCIIKSTAERLQLPRDKKPHLGPVSPNKHSPEEEKHALELCVLTSSCHRRSQP